MEHVGTCGDKRQNHGEIQAEKRKKSRSAAWNNGKGYSAKMKSNHALLKAELLIHCPDCDTDHIDLLDPEFDEHEKVFNAIFKDSFESLVGLEITCEHCGNVFTLSEIEW